MPRKITVKQPENHYNDNPADEPDDYNGPEIDYTIHPGSAGGDASDVKAAVGNVAEAYQKRKGSRSEAADRMMEG